MDYHDALAAVGAGAAHPGAMASTALWAERVQPDASWRVLDVGCGTGRTLVYLRERFGCEIVGVDIRPAMIRKARRRAELAQVKGTWRVAPAHRLPFSDASFDLVITESVNVFLDPHLELPAALHEVHRVLNPGGFYVSVKSRPPCIPSTAPPNSCMTNNPAGEPAGQFRILCFFRPPADSLW
ncbi:hypothetical protein GCM10010885_01250 [Alicyclobacillus cellulosilyticus]|uniref:Methyltransferase domain-containing protein n=1 Tax=Alicyclobacillus cellulosilyticus TaxID=1003997 RepID=A0A917K1Y0_9BACL|nr:hypothetical protein GCM10010885_01250 [Alicyclobacillus cellulosilyticus]